jgi:DNA gyrase/topoisomerase IV subunit A
MLNKNYINKKEISKKMKLTVYKTTYLPTLTYSSETWSLTTKHIGQIQSMEMRYLRRIEREKVRNETIRLVLVAMPLQSIIEESHLRRFGRVCCMNKERYSKMVWQARQQGK